MCYPKDMTLKFEVWEGTEGIDQTIWAHLKALGAQDRWKYRINLQPFFNLQSMMKQFSMTRQKLVLNRVRKTSTPPKPQIQPLNGQKVTTLHTPLAARDSNALKLANSSIFGKQSEAATLLRCRSISCVDKKWLQDKPMPSLNKIYSVPQDDSHKNVCPEVRLAAIQFAHSLKQRGHFSIKNNSYNIPCDILTNLMLEFGEKIRQQFDRERVIQSDGTFSSKPDSFLHLTIKHPESFVIQNQFALALNGVCKQLSYLSEVISIKVQGESLKQSQCFQETVDSLALHPEQQAISFLCNKLKYLQQEVSKRQAHISQLYIETEGLNKSINKEKKKLQEIQVLVKQQQQKLNQVERQVKELESFIHRQPNKILQQQAEGYKQRQQQLFDLAFLLEQSSVESMAAYIQETILIPSESFKLTLQTFSTQQPDEHGNYTILKKNVEAFCSSLHTAYESTVSKLKSIIETKASKIRNFVGIMRRLASYTIGKREYLTEINKKMATASIKADQHIIALRQACPQEGKGLDKLQGLVNCMKNIYCEAEVFY